MPYEYDLIIVGAGPAGIFTALELLRKSAGPKAPRTDTFWGQLFH